GPGFHSAGDDLAALLFQAGHAGEHRDIAGRPTNVRWQEAKQVRPRLIEAGDPKVASHDNDGNFNGIKDVDQIRRCGRVVTIDPLQTGPAASSRNGLRHYRVVREAVYRPRLRCSTGSATAGRTRRNARSNASARGISKGGR